MSFSKILCLVVMLMLMLKVSIPTSLGITLILMAMGFIYYFHSMASSSNSSETSTSSIQKRFKYDVFISFKGEDTRKNFVDHLYHALKDKGIYTYKDDERIQKGKRIKDDLIESIEDSKFYIIVFSKNYASSSWCLEELVKIMECQKMTEHTAYIVFYDVEPTEVRHQSGAVGEAFSRIKRKRQLRKWIEVLKKVFSKNKEEEEWKEALKDAADLAGWELKNTLDGHEAKFIKKIVQEISLELRSISSGFDKKLVGMETRVDDVVSSLEIGIDEVRMIGIKGMGGAGKTTTARAVFDHISNDFEAKSFVENVREVSTILGLKKLQEQVLSDVLKEDVTVNGVTDGKNMMKERMCGKKVLLVLDDVDHIDKLEALAGEPKWFKPGSRIIITTRDEQVLVVHRVHVIRDIALLSEHEAICLFSRYAFGTENPIQGYEELSGKVVRYAAGLPLTVKVLGSFLCGKDKLEWVDAIDRLKRIPLKDTLEKLELSYISLEDDYKEIFLDIACILKGVDREYAITILESCGFYARNGLKVLEQRSLITISVVGCLEMHDHIEELGKNIVRRLHPDEPKNHSRLWIDKEIEDILANDKGTEATRCLKLKTSRRNSRIVIKGLVKMKKIRYLEVDFAYYDVFLSFRGEDTSKNYVEHLYQALMNEGIHTYKNDEKFQKGERISDELIDAIEASKVYIIIFSKNYASSSWCLEELVKILECCKMAGHAVCPVFYDVEPSEVRKQSGAFGEAFAKYEKEEAAGKWREALREAAELSGWVLKNTPDGHEAKYIRNIVEDLLHSINSDVDRKLIGMETQIRDEPSNLVGLDMRMTQLWFEEEEKVLKELKFLSLYRSNLTTFDFGMTPNLDTLSLKYSYNLVELCMRVTCQNLKHLDISFSKLRTFDLGLTPNLEKLSLACCGNLEEICMPVSCQKLKHLNISCSKLRIFDLGLTPNIETLSLRDSRNLEELCMPVSCQKLKHLNISCSKLRIFDIGLTPNIETLSLRDSRNLEELCMPVSCQKLKHLNISCSKLKTFDLGFTPNLETLSLDNCADFEELHVSVACPNLKNLDLSKSRLRSLDLELIPNLESLNLDGCGEFVEINAPVGCLQKAVYLNLYGRLWFTYFPKDNCSSATLDLAGLFIDLCPLHPNSNLPKLQFRGSYEENLPSSVGNIEKLISFGLCACTDFKKLSDIICSLQCLKKLTLVCDIPEFPKDLGQLECLEELCLYSDKIKHLPDSICMLKRLKSLKVNNGYYFSKLPADLLEKLPDYLGQLECLEELYMSSNNIEYIPDSICMLKRLKTLDVRDCCRLGKLPEDIGQLESLERLVLTATRIKHLPDSLCMLKHLKYLNLACCALLEKLPDDVGRLECLEHLDITDTGISHLPQSIFGLKRSAY